jgi:hypothetical protein
VIEQPSANQNRGMLAYVEEGATNPGKDLYVINNTFLNDDSSRGTFVLAGAGVTTAVRLENNIFAGIGQMSDQVNAVDKYNYRSVAPGFVNRAVYDLRATPNALVINAGSLPGKSASGVSLQPDAGYRHRAPGTARLNQGAIDIGAYEAGQ